MRRTATTVLTLAAALACGACGSHGATAPAPSSTTAPSTSAAAAPAQGGAQQCQTVSWPQRLPDFRGKSLGDTVVGPALCYDIAKITAADGTDVMHNPTAMTKSWTVTGESPAPGTQVTAETPIALKVIAAQ
ncbi:hypothetical protein [Nocardia alni]|uniref:hypothetical protein n=1 Tax=Nocardia alni TaxID=2815723 RepID=UPI001C22A2DB|nr:hypothetical protein [Nocardia alni]